MVERKKDWLDPKAEGKKTDDADFDRNRHGLYGGLPEVRLALVKDSVNVTDNKRRPAKAFV